MKESLSLCQICKEPIWNFLCIDCLERHIKRWLPVKLSSDFEKFHNTFSRYFRSFLNSEYCMHCKSYKDKPVCPYCYTNEVYHWLKGENRDLAFMFMNVFSFDFERSGFEEPVKMENLIPISENREIQRQSGICDECGEYSEELGRTENGLSCTGCMEI